MDKVLRFAEVQLNHPHPTNRGSMFGTTHFKMNFDCNSQLLVWRNHCNYVGWKLFFFEWVKCCTLQNDDCTLPQPTKPTVLWISIMNVQHVAYAYQQTVSTPVLRSCNIFGRRLRWNCSKELPPKIHLTVDKFKSFPLHFFSVNKILCFNLRSLPCIAFR